VEIPECIIPVRDYDLAATLASGQAFRWTHNGHAWDGVVGNRWVQLSACPEGIAARKVSASDDWSWLEGYLQTNVELDPILRSFPDDEPMRAAVAACRGLRLLRQDPWECLASFILSSTKRIVQIRQIVELLCLRYGEPIITPPGRPTMHAFPTAQRLAGLSEADLRACKMGFRAPKLLATARLVATGGICLDGIGERTLDEARAELLRCPGVGEKIANCVLLFAGGFANAFPVDVWVMKAMREWYFPKRRPQPARLRHFIATHFGPNAGWAQQYLFHYMRVKKRNGSDA
jgi:N-glycosylase/DNA lyase